MALPWLTNLWGCNTWDGDVERTVAADTAKVGMAPTRVQSGVEPVAVPPDTESTPEGRFTTLAQGWPVNGPLIPLDRYVRRDRDDELAKRFLLEEHNTVKPTLACYDRALFQLARGGFTASGRPPSDTRSYLVFVERIDDRGSRFDDLDLERMTQAVEYLKTSIAGGVPVLVGVRLSNFPRRDMDRESTPEIYPTNHFIVIVGANSDSFGPYFTYYDSNQPPGNPDTYCRLYLLSSMFMQTVDGALTLSEVRSSSPRRVVEY